MSDTEMNFFESAGNAAFEAEIGADEAEPETAPAADTQDSINEAMDEVCRGRGYRRRFRDRRGG